ncbi:asparagine synthase-related protein [Halegenticoccus tardaugens]|uniref:asparagine synthase-related protein n=1 Tax=Halegenticoccus tardaugens TaxID=2071624 RepID=UPI00100B1610|nr:asparagine synthase-related protein [Halegenticoccus tardaugens]
MDGRLTVLVSDPDARAIETEAGTWVVSALDADAVEGLLRRAESISEVRRRVGSATEDAALVYVPDDRRAVHAYRTVVGSRSLFYLRGSDGGAVVTDHFKSALARLAVEDRTVTRAAIADHLLYRTPLPPYTVVSEIESVPQGAWLAWDLATEERTTTAVDRLSPKRPLRPATARARLDETLAGLLDLDGDEDALNLYSGGVDSTLVQTYLDDAPMLHVGVDSPEYAFEIEYARDGAARFDAEFRQEILDERGVLARLESCVDALGSPSLPLMSGLIDAAFDRCAGRRYVMAIGADALCGSTGTKSARVASWLGPALTSSVSAPLRRLAPGSVGAQLDWFRTIAEQLRFDSADPRSFPQHFAAYTKPALVADLLGEDVVARRCREGVRYVHDRVDVGAGDSFGRRIEMAHLLSIYSHQTGCRWRQLAASHGHSLVTPFETRSATESALAVPSPRRYVTGPPRSRRLSTKHLLKRLLARRLPSYPTAQPKGSGVLPFGRYLSEGALAHVFDRYPAPAFVAEATGDAAIENSGRQAWNLITYVIWRDRVLRNDDLRPAPTSVRLESRAAARVG